jgi:hypothetical protein
MAVSLTTEERHAGNGYLIRSGYGNLGAYVTSGVAVIPNDCGGLGIIDYLDVGNVGAYRFEVTKTDATHWLVLAYTDDGTTGISAEVGNAVDLAAVVFRWQARGSY